MPHVAQTARKVSGGIDRQGRVELANARAVAGEWRAALAVSTYTCQMATRPRTVRLTPASYDLLEQEARRRGTDPDALADELLRSDLAAPTQGNMRAALAGLAELRAGLPEIDGVALARGARRELEERGA